MQRLSGVVERLRGRLNVHGFGGKAKKRELEKKVGKCLERESEIEGGVIF